MRRFGPAGARVPRFLVLHDRQLAPHAPGYRQGRAHGGGANPRFVVTSLKRGRTAYDARGLYEQLYCARGEAENRIGEQFELFADRASSATLQANQLRMWLSAMAYVLVDTLRRVGLRHSQFADASGCPNKIEFELAYLYLQRAFSSA